MKITRKQLRKLILKETRKMHVQGIKSKIAKLEAELAKQRAALQKVDTEADQAAMMTGDDFDAYEIQSRYGDPIRSQIFGIEDKRDFLQSQADAFDEAGDGPVDLPRG
jgi:rubrerythrin